MNWLHSIHRFTLHSDGCPRDLFVPFRGLVEQDRGQYPSAEASQPQTGRAHPFIQATLSSLVWVQMIASSS